MRKIALDIGDVRIGIAISDMLGIIANPYETYRTRGTAADIEYFSRLVAEMQCDTIVIGLPINMDGTEGPRAEGVRAFGAKLQQHTTATIVYQDERLTTVSAQQLLIDSGMRRDKRKEVVDKVAASIILSSYLDMIANKGDKEMSEKDLETEILDEELEGEDETIITLQDDAGNPVDFRLIDVVEYEENDYAVLAPVKAIEGIGEDEVLIFKIVDSGDGEDSQLLPPDSEEIADAVFNLFVEQYYADEDGCGCGCDSCDGHCGDEE